MVKILDVIFIQTPSAILCCAPLSSTPAVLRINFSFHQEWTILLVNATLVSPTPLQFWSLLQASLLHFLKSVCQWFPPMCQAPHGLFRLPSPPFLAGLSACPARRQRAVAVTAMSCCHQVRARSILRPSAAICLPCLLPSAACGKILIYGLQNRAS